MTRIGLFFGSFDPPHIGHVDLVASALNAKVVDRVMVIPAWQNVWKSDSSPYPIRLEMCQRAFRGLAIVSNIEQDVADQSGGTVYTYDVVKFLKNQYASYGLDKTIEFVMLTSLETWKEIPSWKGGGLLLKEISMIVEGIDFHCNNIPIHATQLRNLIKEGKYTHPFIQDTVYEVIKMNKLYI